MNHGQTQRSFRRQTQDILGETADSALKMVVSIEVELQWLETYRLPLDKCREVAGGGFQPASVSSSCP